MTERAAQPPMAAILAGGQGRRLGGAIKPLVVIDGRTIIDRQLEVLRARFAEVVLCSSRPEPLRSIGLPIVADAPGPAGPLAGVIAALEYGGGRDVFVVAGDMPFLSLSVVDRFLDTGRARPSASIVATRVAGITQPVHAIYRAGALAVLSRARAAGDGSLRRIIDGAVDEVAWVSEAELGSLDPERAFSWNVNWPAQTGLKDPRK